jgi:hypothetical protein
MGMAQSLLKLAGVDWQVPDFSTISRLIYATKPARRSKRRDGFPASCTCAARQTSPDADE